MPGETFSYNKVVGARTIQAGYKEAPIYVSGRVEDGIGGGICQITTTLYNAVVYANLDIVEINNNKIHLIKSLHFANPNYQPVSNDNLNRVIPSKENIIGYLDICATKEYIYALYADKKRFTDNKSNNYNSDTILVFDWNGNHIEKMFDKKLIFDDIMGKDDFWGDFIVHGTEFQFQIHWESSTITIFLKGGVEIIDSVKHFNLGF